MKSKGFGLASMVSQSSFDPKPGAPLLRRGDPDVFDHFCAGHHRRPKVYVEEPTVIWIMDNARFGIPAIPFCMAALTLLACTIVAQAIRLPSAHVSGALMLGNFRPALRIRGPEGDEVRHLKCSD